MAVGTPEPDPRHERVWRIIFLSDTRAGRAFDVALLVAIGLSVAVLMLESVQELRADHGPVFRALEWVFTALFTVEYVARLRVVRRPWAYASSFFGVVDLLSILPSYLGLLIPGTHYLMTLRVLRLMRMFRVLKLAEYLGEANTLLGALHASRRKIVVFLLGMLSVVFVEGTVMYVVEQGANPDFSNIPQSVYWAIVTVTTVGYGDVAPVTLLGKMMASIVMLTGFAILAVPTGIVTYEIGREMRERMAPQVECQECGWREHGPRARFCQQCGLLLRG